MEIRRLKPDPVTVDVEALLDGLAWGEDLPPGRPRLALNMIATLDGKAALGGRTRGMGNAADRLLFHGLRARADAVMVGAGTARVERYGRLVRDPAARARRSAAGLAPDPLACVVSGRLDLPADLPLLEDTGSRVLVSTCANRELAPGGAAVEYFRQTSSELRPLLDALRGQHQVSTVLCEGGPTLNAQLLSEGLVDELFLSLSPKVVGGAAAPTIVAGAPPLEIVDLDLVWCLESEGHLFNRYRLRRGERAA